MTLPVRIFVVDDHSLFREGLLRLLEHDQQLKVAGSASSAAEAMQRIPGSNVDVVILDYDLGEQTALDLLRQLRGKEAFGGKILVVTAGVPNHHVLELVSLGISGIFHKQHTPETLQRTILDVAEGKVFLEQDHLRNLVESASVARQAPLRLTDRDRQILRLLLEGLSNKEISAQLLISESAVKASLQQLFAKTGVRTRSQLVRIALEQLRDQI
ncbi:MAG: response regulator transcription factor [Candidatus Korobacteraceae bacterium]